MRLRRRPWRVEDTEVLRQGREGEIRHVRLPNGTLVSIRQETLAEMCVSTLRELRTRPTRKAELRRDLLRRVCSDEEWRVVEEIVAAFPDEQAPPSLAELLGQVDGEAPAA